MGYELFMMKEQFYVQWHVTNRCNLRCRHCYQDDFSQASELDWPELSKVAHHLLESVKGWGKTACIHLTGGEPLLKAEIIRLLERLDRDPAVAELGMITNGLLLNQEVLRRLTSYSKLRKIKISLDGANAATNDTIRSRGTFQRVVETIRLAKQEERFEVIIMFTLMRSNFRELIPLIQLCQDLGVNGLILERFIPLGRGRGILDQVLTKDDWKEFVASLSSFFSIDPSEPQLLPYQAFQIQFPDGEPELLGAPCTIGKDGLCLMPDGGVFPCRRFPVSIGNLIEEPLETVWERSDLLQALRRRASLKGQCGSCKIEGCLGCRSLAYSLSGDPFSEDPHCRRK